MHNFLSRQWLDVMNPLTIMKFTLSSFLLLLTAASYGQGNPEQPKNRPHEPGREKMRALEFWKKADTNDDKKLSKEEFVQLPRISQLPAEKQDKLFAHLDKNRNDALEPGEMIPAGAPANPDMPPPGDAKRRPMPRIAEMDRDGDRKITFEEFVQGTMVAKLPEDRRRKIFDNMDRNKDGVLSPEDGPAPGQGPRRPDGGRPDGGRPDRVPGNPVPPSPARGFGAVDTNSDKNIDFPEFQQFPMVRQQGEDAQEDLFEKIDTNRDLKIDATEWQKHWENRKPGDEAPRERPQRPAPAAPRGDDEMMMEDGI